MNEPEAGDVIQDADWAGTMRSLEQISERFPGDFKDATKQSRTGVWNLLTEHQGKHSTLRSVRKVVGIGIGSPTRVKDPAFERTMARLEVFFGLAEEMSRKTEFVRPSQILQSTWGTNWSRNIFQHTLLSLLKMRRIRNSSMSILQTAK